MDTVRLNGIQRPWGQADSYNTLKINKKVILQSLRPQNENPTPRQQQQPSATGSQYQPVTSFKETAHDMSRWHLASLPQRRTEGNGLFLSVPSHWPVYSLT